jgi:hypothetical protein
VGGRELTIQLRTLPHVRWIDATVEVNGARFKTVKRSQLTRPVKLTGLPSGRFVLSITARTSTGRSVTATRDYRTCVPISKIVQPVTPVSPVTPVTPVTPEVPVTPEEPVTPSAPQPGRYHGDDTEGDELAFYVSTDQKHLQDVTVYVGLQCTPKESFNEHLYISEVQLESNGSFSGTSEQKSVVKGETATIKSTVNGHIAGSTATGAVQDEITYDHSGIKYECTSGEYSWTATLDSQGSTPASAPVGRYHGSDAEGVDDELAFYVSTDQKHLQDVTVYIGLQCAPENSFNEHLYIGEVELEPDGSFSGTSEQKSVIKGEPATIKATLSGHLHTSELSGPARFAGMVRDEITYDHSGIKYECTSGEYSWTATLDSQGSTPASAPAGSYAGDDAEGDELAFVVPEGAASLQDVTVYIGLQCTPEHSLDDHFAISEIALEPDGSFSGTTEKTGVIEGVSATFKYTLSGHLHTSELSGPARFAGMVRDEITYDNGTKYECTSGDYSWTAKHT